MDLIWHMILIQDIQILKNMLGGMQVTKAII